MERLFRIAFETFAVIWMMILGSLYRTYGFAKTSETLDEALDDVRSIREHKARRKERNKAIVRKARAKRAVE